MKHKLLLIFIFIGLIVATVAPASAVSESLIVNDLSGSAYTFTIQQLESMLKITEYAELYCYGVTVTNGNWTGIQLSYLLNQTSLNSNVNSIQFVAADQYAISIPIQVANSPQTIIAYQKNDQPLTEGLRLVLPGYNGASWIAQIVSITMSSDFVAYPASVSFEGSIPRSVLNEFNGKVLPSIPNASLTPKPTVATNTPTPNVPASAANNTEAAPTLKQQTANPQQLNLNQILIPGAVSTLAAIFVAAILAFKHKSKHATEIHLS